MGATLTGHDLFKVEIAAMREQFPLLNFIFLDGIPCLKGVVELKDPEKKIVDTYEILIKSIESYPNKFPQVFELGGKFPKNVDWHVFPDLSCCLASPPEETLICIDGINLNSFIEKHVIPYFFNQTFRRENGYFLNERAHGDLGWIEFFYEILRTKDINHVIKTLELILSGVKIERTAMCICGSKKKYRNCHRDAIHLLRKLPKDDIAQYYQKLLSYRR